MAANFSVKAVISAVDRFTRPFDRMMSGASRRVSSFVGGVGKAAGGLALTGGALYLGGKAIVDAGEGILDFAKSYTEGADAMSKAARRIGLSTDSFQEYRFAAELAGVATNEFDAGVEAFAKNIGELKLGRGPLAEFLRKADPQFGKLLKHTEDTEGALGAMMLAFEQIEDPTKRSALAAAAFGDAGRKMTLMMEGGADGLKKAREQAHQFNKVIGRDALSRTEAFNDSITRTTALFGGFRNTVADSLITALQPALNEFEEWVTTNPDKVRTIAQDIGVGLADAFKWVANAVKDTIKWFRTAVTDIENFFDTLETRFAKAWEGPARIFIEAFVPKGGDLFTNNNPAQMALALAGDERSRYGQVTARTADVDGVAQDIVASVGDAVDEQLAADRQRGEERLRAIGLDVDSLNRAASERAAIDALVAGMQPTAQEILVTIKAPPGMEAEATAKGPGPQPKVARNTGVSPVGRGDGTIP